MVPRGKHDSYLDFGFAKPRHRSVTKAAIPGPVHTSSYLATPGADPVLIRLTDSSRWKEPLGVVISSRMGIIVSAAATREGVAYLERDPRVLSISASRPGGMRDAGGPQTNLEVVKADVIHRPPLEELGDRALIGIIDTGIDVLHEAFTDDEGNCRILEIWDQTNPAGPSPAVAFQDPDLPGYGTLYLATEIIDWIHNEKVPEVLGRDPGQHGTRVASVAAGRPVGSFSGGVAPGARILFVIPKLDPVPADQQFIGYCRAHLDALAYLRKRAEMIPGPIVVNVSSGINCGAHDGTSDLEIGFDEFSKRGQLPGRVIVKSAGNECGQEGHAALPVMHSGQLDELRWRSDGNVGRPEDLLEAWFPSVDEYEFVLVDPNSDATAVCSLANPTVQGSFPLAESYQLRYEQFHPDNGESVLQLILRPNDGGKIRGGEWRLRVRATRIRSDRPLHAWFERYLLDVGSRRATRFTRYVEDTVTLTIPGTASSVITVGGIDQAGMSTSGSSFGLTRDARLKPEVVAPGTDVSVALAGSRTSASLDTGTSFAAPHVTGAVALLLSHYAKQGTAPPTSLQIRAGLMRNTQISASHTSSAGYGLIDVEEFFHDMT